MNLQSLQHESWPSNLSGFPKSLISVQSIIKLELTPTGVLPPPRQHDLQLQQEPHWAVVQLQVWPAAPASGHSPTHPVAPPPELFRELLGYHCSQVSGLNQAPLPCSRIPTTIHDTHVFLSGRMSGMLNVTLKALDYTSRFLRATLALHLHTSEGDVTVSARCLAQNAKVPTPMFCPSIRPRRTLSTHFSSLT